MLTPADKVTRRGGNDIMQVVVTNKCDVFTCSNCTQLLPFRTDDREMTLACAEESLLSLRGWPGVVAMFGGNPVTHSRFEDLCELWTRLVPDQRRRGLWTNNLMSDSKGEAARKAFWPHGRFNLNIHGGHRAAGLFAKHLPGVKVWGERPSHHAAVLGSHADLGVSEADWVAARERCDINQNWSGAVYQRPGQCPRCGGVGVTVPRPADAPPGVADPIPCQDCEGTGTVPRPYGYFCEVAGAIDGVTGENHGVPAVGGWWRRRMSDFDHQVVGCCDKRCIVPLRVKGHLDSESTYDVTRTTVPLTDRRTGKVLVAVHSKMSSQVKELTDYQGLRS